MVRGPLHDLSGGVRYSMDEHDGMMTDDVTVVDLPAERTLCTEVLPGIELIFDL